MQAIEFESEIRDGMILVPHEHCRWAGKTVLKLSDATNPDGERRKDFMPEVMIDIPIRKLAYMIDSMSSQEIETLYMFLTEEGSELLERNRDLELGRVKYLSEEEAFDV